MDHRDNHAAIAAAGCARFGDRLGQFRDITKLLLQSGATIEELTAQTPKPAPRPRRARKPTLASVAKQASKAGLEVGRFEIEPDGKIVIVIGKSSGVGNDAAANEWDEEFNGAAPEIH